MLSHSQASFSRVMRLALSLSSFRKPTRLAPVLGVPRFGQWLALALAGLMLLYAQLVPALPLAQWRWVDVLGEGSMALMLAVWLTQLRASRPAGRVTDFLCLGVASMLAGQWVDLLDEFWRLPKSVVWDNALESGLMPLGMVLLTWGLHLWRQEQLALANALRGRERLFREHRSLDGVTQLGDASYMAAQITLERQRGCSGVVLMLGWTGFDRVLRERGLAEAERMLQAASQLLLLHLRADDLLCRYGAERFVVLLPGTDSHTADTLGQDLQQALARFAYPLSDGSGRLRLPATLASAPIEGEGPPDALLFQLVALR